MDDTADDAPKQGDTFDFQKECTNDDTISTMGGTHCSQPPKAVTPSKKLRTQTIMMDMDNASNALSLLGNTKYTLQTKMLTMEITTTDIRIWKR